MIPALGTNAGERSVDTRKSLERCFDRRKIYFIVPHDMRRGHGGWTYFGRNRSESPSRNLNSSSRLKLLSNRQIPLISEVSIILGIAVICVPLMACVMWTIPDTTVEGENDHKVAASVESIETEKTLEQISAEEPVKDEPSSIVGLQKVYTTSTPNHVV